MGKYREIEDGILAKPSTDNSVTNPEGLPGIDGTIPYEELKQQILEASDSAVTSSFIQVLYMLDLAGFIQRISRL